MDKHELTGLIKEKGWTVKDFLEHIGRSYPWYHDNCNGTDKQRIRLKMLVDGLPQNKQEYYYNGMPIIVDGCPMPKVKPSKTDEALSQVRNALDRDEEDGYWEIDSRGEFCTRKLKDGRVWFKQLKRSRKSKVKPPKGDEKLL